MNITIVTVGKLKEKYLKQGIEEYLKRLSAYAKVDIIEVPDEKAPETLSDTEMEQIKQKEGERILAKVHPDAHVIALAIEGKITFIIGGSLGLSKEVMQRANDTLSFSKMTFPHQLMRLILVEQVYRAYRINRGEPYHK